MKTTVSKWEFQDAFRNMGRQDQFSIEALNLLYDWFEEYDDSCGTETDLDVIAICCDFYESDADEIINDYSLDPDTDIAEYLNDNTLLVGKTSGSYVYMAF